MTGQGHVQDNTPSHTDMVFRFYVIPQLAGSGTAKVFAAYSAENGTGELFNITWTGTGYSFNPTGGSSTNFPTAGGWSLIEVAYSAGGTSSFWVNSQSTEPSPDPADGTFTAAAGAIESVRLGLIDGLGGFDSGNANFDAYESHATTPVGPLLNGDANDSGGLSIADAITIGLELNGTLAPGQPDCNSSGGVTIADAICVGVSL